MRRQASGRVHAPVRRACARACRYKVLFGENRVGARDETLRVIRVERKRRDAPSLGILEHQARCGRYARDKKSVILDGAGAGDRPPLAAELLSRRRVGQPHVDGDVVAGAAHVAGDEITNVGLSTKRALVDCLAFFH